MTNDSLLSKNDIIRNTLESSNRIKFDVHKGVLRANILDEDVNLVINVPCLQDSLDFTCSINSQYIPLL